MIDSESQWHEMRLEDVGSCLRIARVVGDSVVDHS
jgi:hypothetical protein